MTVSAPGARISLICLLVVAAVAAAIPAESRSLQATQPSQLIQRRTHSSVAGPRAARPARVGAATGGCRGASVNACATLVGLDPARAASPAGGAFPDCAAERHRARRVAAHRPTQAGAIRSWDILSGIRRGGCPGRGVPGHLECREPVGDRRGSGGSGKASGDGLDFDDCGSVRVGNGAVGAARAPGLARWRCTSASCWPPAPWSARPGTWGRDSSTERTT